MQDYTKSWKSLLALVNATCFKELSIFNTDEKQMKYTVKLPQGLSKSPGHYFYQQLLVNN